MKKRVMAWMAAATCFGTLATANAATDNTRVVVERRDATPTIEAGVMAGFPTGFSFKYWMDSRSAHDLGISRNFATTGYMGNVDYLLHSVSLSGNDPNVRLPLYIGAGARLIRFDDGDTGIGPRLPIGAEALLVQLPLSFFAEIAPAVEFTRGNSTVTADAGVGARLVF